MKQSVSDYSYEYKKAKQAKITRISAACVICFIFLSLFFRFFLFPVSLKTSSMESSLPKESVVFVCPMIQTPSRGQVVYLSRMDNENVSFLQRTVNNFVKFFTLQKVQLFGASDRMSGSESLRRVVAVPGDTVCMKDYILYVKPAKQTQYLSEFEVSSKDYEVSVYSVPVEWAGLGISGNFDNKILGKDEYFVLADNRIEGIDSRVYGVVDASRIKGVAVWKFFPFNKMKLL